MERHRLLSKTRTRPPAAEPGVQQRRNKHIDRRAFRSAAALAGNEERNGRRQPAAVPVQRGFGSKDRNEMAEAVGRDGSFRRCQCFRRPDGRSGPSRRLQHAVLRHRHVPVPLGQRPARGASIGLYRHGYDVPLPPHEGRERAACHRFRRLRSAGGAVRRPDRPASACHHGGEHRQYAQPAAPHGPEFRLPPLLRHD